MEEVEFKRRVPSKLKFIKEISKDDVRVRFFGVVTSMDDTGVMTVDDGSQITVIAMDAENIKVGDTVMVVGIVMPYEEGVEIRGEIVKKVKLNMQLYKKFMEIWGEADVKDSN
ncbi:replication protein RepA [Nanoarchaeota archaeon]|nr:MAG: replication protein RepA [Nanoarchaeota archaeon]